MLRYWFQTMSFNCAKQITEIVRRDSRVENIIKLISIKQKTTTTVGIGTVNWSIYTCQSLTSGLSEANQELEADLGSLSGSVLGLVVSGTALELPVLRSPARQLEGTPSVMESLLVRGCLGVKPGTCQWGGMQSMTCTAWWQQQQGAILSTAQKANCTSTVIISCLHSLIVMRYYYYLLLLGLNLINFQNIKQCTQTCF